ncbi:hypothetical protein L1887_40717 [Cichorium endivia]|nr:hypothetical protein L1887_40717 [Cichorium endivia]
MFAVPASIDADSAEKNVAGQAGAKTDYLTCDGSTTSIILEHGLILEGVKNIGYQGRTSSTRYMMLQEFGQLIKVNWACNTRKEDTSGLVTASVV